MLKKPLNPILHPEARAIFIPKGPRGTSEKYHRKTRQFLESIDVRPAVVKDQTHIIIATADGFELPMSGQQLRIRTQTQLNLIFVAMKIAAEHGKIDEATIATYTLNSEAWAVFLDLVDSGRIGALNLLLASSYSFRDKAQYQNFKIEATKRESVHLVFAWSHFKISLFRCGGDCYQVEGSMNYSQNNMAEQIIVENNPDLYAHDYDFITKIMQSRDTKALEVVC